MLPFLAASNPTHHVLDRPITGLEDTVIFAGETFTIHVVTLTVAAIIALLVLLRAAKSISTGEEGEGMYRYLTKGRVAQLIEVFTLFLVENTIRPTLKEETRRFAPLLLSLFFFILTCNLMGLIPFLDVQHALGPAVEGQKVWAVFGGTATANLGVTLGLACVAFMAIQYQGFRSLGVKGYLSHLTGGAPLALLPMMVPLEIAGMLIKPAALAVRLFANMFAGHTMMAVLAIFGMMAYQSSDGNLWLTGSISIVSIVASIAITFLELFVAFLQAFIFMFLTTVFIGQMTHHHEHDDHHEDAHGAAQPAGAH